MKRPWVRVILFVLVLIGIVVLPWWLSVVILVGLTIYIPFYPEVLFFGFLFDTLYVSHYTFPYTALTIATMFLIVVMFVRTRIRT